MPSAVLLSGGLDSAVLLAEEAAAEEVQPIYVSVGLAHPLQIDAPFDTISKADVVRRGRALGVDFTRTLSCMNPRSGTGLGHRSGRDSSPMHCGLCSKCRERHDAFVEAGLTDPTE